MLVTACCVVSLACAKQPTRNAETKASQASAARMSEDKSGLSEVERRQICDEISSTRMQAVREAESKYPFVKRGDNHGKMIERERKRSQSAGDIAEEALIQLASRHGLTRDQLNDIEIEGLDKEWIKPLIIPQEYR